MVLDINMPGLDGFGVLRCLKTKGSMVPTLVLTARNQSSDVREAVALGARDFLAKPFKDQQLLARVARLLRQLPAAKPEGSRALRL
jgi:DNA-binding response OmpR family regulator